MRILLVDAPPQLRDQCVAHIAAEWPGAEVDCNTSAQPRLTRGADGSQGWQQYDALLVNNRNADAADGATEMPSAIAWLHSCQERIHVLPPAILLSDEGGEDLAVQAMKLGAADYLRKAALTPARLTRAINDAILERARLHDRDLARVRIGARADDRPTQPIDIDSIGVAAAADAPRINGYRLLRKIGSGGTSKVFLAERLPRLGQAPPSPTQVVLKILDAQLMNGFFIERFIREYRIISGVQNEHVSRIYDQGVTDDHVYIAMEYFSGGDLRARLGKPGAASGPRLTSMQTLKIVTQVARALDAIHSAGVIHRDLKPNNIMFRHNGQLGLVDFGVAKQIGENTVSGSGGLSSTGGLFATPLYMSPEQCLGQPQDARSDLYSLGVTLYEMFTGQRLFESDNVAAVAYSHVHGEVPPLPPNLAGYQTLMDRLLAKHPDERFQSARELFAYVAY